MRKFNLRTSGTAALVGMMWSLAQTTAADLASVERIQMTGGQMLVVLDGQTVPMTNEVILPYEIRVKTNGTFTVQGRRSRTLKEGQILGADGMLLSPDGHIEPVLDHLALTAGKTFLSADGDTSQARRDIRLGNGALLTPDRVLLSPNGTWMRVIDGQLLTPAGTTIPAKDTISLRDGKVIVQKDGPLADGSLLSVPPNRSLMMNDGTKVFGDGTLIARDGKVTKLSEGQTLVIEGVIKLR
jgi:hypothetical protein